MRKILLILIMAISNSLTAQTLQSDGVFTFTTVTSAQDTAVKRLYVLQYSVIGIAEVQVEYRITGTEIIHDSVYNYPQLGYGLTLFELAEDTEWTQLSNDNDGVRRYLYQRTADRLNLTITE